MKLLLVIFNIWIVLAQKAQKAVLNYSQIIDDIVCAIPQGEERARDLGGLVRLVFHDVAGGSGGANGCFDVNEPANAGLAEYSDLIEPVVQKYRKSLSRADIWVLAGHVVIYITGGPSMGFNQGRKDCHPNQAPSDVGFLPTTTMTFPEVLAIMQTRMGLTPQEITALMGAHSLGGAEAENSGMEGNQVLHNWRFTNEYYRESIQMSWKRSTTKFGADKPVWLNNRHQLLRFDTDMQLMVDTTNCQSLGPKGAHRHCPYNPLTHGHFQNYANNQTLWFQDFSSAFQKLVDLGYTNLKPVNLPLRTRVAYNTLSCPPPPPPPSPSPPKPKGKGKDNKVVKTKP